MKTILKLTAILLFASGIFCSCGKEEAGNESVSLKGTSWKLAGFADILTGETKEAEPVSEKCYHLIFNDDDNTLAGVACSNPLTGTYVLNEKKSSIRINIWALTEINELFDGNLYLESLNDVRYFSLNENELRLYYAKKYLLFKKLSL